ncbi:MAG: hypothetical protein JXA03_11920 [Bacteroidales bacterium]|nr:hypothetical protein [Bacteroidales bacterium]
MQNAFIVHSLIFILVFHLVPRTALCQGEEIRMGKSGGLAGSAVAVPGFWAVSDNVAGLAELADPTGGVFFGNRFGIRELSAGAVAVAFPSPAGVAGALYSHEGFSLWNRQNIGLVLARKLSSRIDAGLRLDYQSITFGEGYGKSECLSFSAGGITKISEKLFLGAQLINPYGLYLREEAGGEIIPSLRMGMMYAFSGQLFCTLEAEKPSGFKPSVKGGMDYSLSDLASVRIGFREAGSQKQTDPLQGYIMLAFGASLKWGNLTADLNTSFHQVLGWSPEISLSCQLNRKGKL